MPDEFSRPRLSLGVDLGGTKILTALVDAEGRVVASDRDPTECAAGFDAVVASITAAARGCLAGARDARPIAMGIGVAGQVDARSGDVVFAPNLGWRNAPLRTTLEAALGIPVVVSNDVRAAAWGEWGHGAAAGERDVAVLFIGTGVGGAVVAGGQMMYGCRNSAGELGHMTIVAGGRECRCRNRGCLEAYVSGWAVAKRAQEAVVQAPGRGAAMLAAAGGVMTHVTAATVTGAYRAGDPLAHELIEETAEYLAAGIVSIVNAFNPCVLVLGGGVVEHVPEYVGLVAPLVAQRALGTATEELSIVRAKLGNFAGVVGAAAMARGAGVVHA